MWRNKISYRKTMRIHPYILSSSASLAEAGSLLFQCMRLRGFIRKGHCIVQCESSSIKWGRLGGALYICKRHNLGYFSQTHHILWTVGIANTIWIAVVKYLLKRLLPIFWLRVVFWVWAISFLDALFLQAVRIVFYVRERAEWKSGKILVNVIFLGLFWFNLRLFLILLHFFLALFLERWSFFVSFLDISYQNIWTQCSSCIYSFHLVRFAVIVDPIWIESLSHG